MFSKAKNKADKGEELTSELMEISDAPERSKPATRQQQKQASRSMTGGGRKPASRSTGVPSLISGDVVIKGTIEAEGEVQFDGQLEGDIRAKGLVIGEGAAVKGEVVAQKVKVSGAVDGAIRAGQVELASSANVKGDILHSALSIETGARFDGNCRHSDDPTSDTAKPKRPMRAAPKKQPTTATAAAEAPAEEAPAPAAAEELVPAEAEAQSSTASSSFLSRGGKSDLR